MSSDDLVRRQWPAALLFLAGSLKAGLTIDAALVLLASEAPEPLKSRLVKACANKTHLPPALRIQQIVNGDGLTLPRAALLFSQRAGGQAAPVLEQCAQTLQSSMEMEERLRALTAQNRTSAWIVSLVPFGVLLFFSLFAPDYIAPLFQTRTGLSVLAIAAALVTVGLMLVRRLARLE